MRKVMLCLMAGALAGSPQRATAQAALAYLALISTPTAGEAPLARQWMTSDPAKGIGFDIDWGHVSGYSGSLDMFTGGFVVPFAEGRADAGLSAGYFKPTCDGGGCDGNFVASGVVEGRVLQSQMSGATFTLGLSGRLGFAKPTGATVWSASAGMPLSVAIGTGGLRVVPFVTPAIGWGHASAGGSSESGERFLLSGGVGLMSSGGSFGLTVGAHHVFIEGGKTVFGAGISLSHR